jgi:hypothetical protein
MKQTWTGRIQRGMNRPKTRKDLLLALLALAALASCSGGGPVPQLPDKVVGHCIYVNQFSNREECREYVGEWTDEAAASDCKGAGSTAVLGQACALPEVLGACILGGEDQRWKRIQLPGGDPALCASSKRGCEVFGGGVFDPQPVCGGTVIDTGDTGLPVFQQPERVCKDPLPGEPAGQSAGGQVCTWEAISGATEEGRAFEDYASCDRVRTQRPYYPVGAAPEAEQPDARLNDPAYVQEVEWVKSQVRATACVCCHSTSAPRGPSNWFLESGPNFANSFFSRGLAMGAGWIDTVGFGAYPPAENNGFSRSTPQNPGHGIFVTTDDARIRRFFEAELAHRGLSKADFEGAAPGAGPLDSQRAFRPTACANGEGVAADGTITWLNGAARYLYVLEADATSPTVPPNLDLPEGTLWRVDVPWNGGTPLQSGAVKYGAVPEGAWQKHPVAGAPPALVSGRTYYLYALADIVQPNSRCLFVAP